MLRIASSRTAAVADAEPEQWLSFLSLLPQLLAPFALPDSPLSAGLRALLTEPTGASVEAYKWLGLAELRLSLTLQLLLNLNAAPRDVRGDHSLALRQVALSRT